MDSQQFDQIASTLARSESRRSAFRFLGAAAVGAFGVAMLGAADSDARRRKKRRGKGKGRCLRSGDLCDSDKQCCGSHDLICEVPQNASNSDTRCCGAQGATCGGVNEDGDFLPPFCCIGKAGRRSFICSESDPNNPNVKGTCIPNPSED